MGSEIESPQGGKEAVRGIAEEIARITEENARLLERLAEGERRFRLISKGVLRVQEAERGRVARELHDGVGQGLTALKIQIELLQRSASDAELAASLAELRELADRALQDVRQISHLLRPQMLDDLGLLPTLRWLARTFQQRTGVVVHLVHHGIEERGDPDLDTLVFRLAQEALTNVAKHARAESAEVHVSRDGERLVLRIEDHGAGFDAVKALAAVEGERGYGLRGMRDRVQLFGGRFSVRSSPGAGAVLEAEVPLGTERG